MSQSELPPAFREGPIPSFGEVLADGTFVELIRDHDSARPCLLLWDGQEQLVGEVVEHRGQRYKPRAIHPTILRQLQLPANVGSSESVRNLLVQIGRLIDQFIGLPQRLTALISRFVLATWLVDAMQTAPRILIQGPDIVRARQLLRLLHCICRRALPMAAINAGQFCSLPSGMRFTVLLDQATVSATLSGLLAAAIRYDNPILRNGELRDLFGAQAILCDLEFGGPHAIRVPCIPSGRQMPPFDHEAQRRAVEELQPKLLAFRLANHQIAASTNFDCSKFAMPLRELAGVLAAATPGDSDLQTELHALLQEDDSEVEAENWINTNTVVTEAILVECREAKKANVYVGEVAEMANKILEGRGATRRLDAGEVGRTIKNLGFSTEPRDAHGVKLRLTNAVCVRAQELGHQLDVPGVRD